MLKHIFAGGLLMSTLMAMSSLAAPAPSFDVNRLNVPADAEVLIVTEGSGLKANVYAYIRDAVEEGETPKEWVLSTMTGDGMLGRKGLYKTQEGDEKTPVGIFKMNTPFGIAKKLDGFPDNYLQVDANDYWNGDSDSPLYNKLVDAESYTDFNKKKSEHLSDYGGYYDYCIDTGYNFEGTPKKGSALFLHCSMGINTGGCVAIPKESMIHIMRLYKEGKTYFACAEANQFDALYRLEEADAAASTPAASLTPAAPVSDVAESQNSSGCTTEITTPPEDAAASDKFRRAIGPGEFL